MAIRIISNVPQLELKNIEELFLNSGATSVTHVEEPDHEFTVMAMFPDKEAHAAMTQRIAGADDPASTVLEIA